MNKHQHHEGLVTRFADELKELFDVSDQAMYLYLDDLHKACNKKFSSMLGFPSPDAWSDMDAPFPLEFVAPKSRSTLVLAYQKAMERGVASSFKVTWKKKSGGTVNSTVILVPVSFEGHMFALHFIS